MKFVVREIIRRHFKSNIRNRLKVKLSTCINEKIERFIEANKADTLSNDIITLGKVNN